MNNGETHKYDIQYIRVDIPQCWVKIVLDMADPDNDEHVVHQLEAHQNSWT